jgi:hypothetical protein
MVQQSFKPTWAMSSTYGTSKVQPGGIRVHFSTHFVKIMCVLCFDLSRICRYAIRHHAAILTTLAAYSRSFLEIPPRSSCFHLAPLRFSPLLVWALSNCFHVSPATHHSTPKVASALSPNRVSQTALPLDHSSTGSAQHGYPLAQ